MKSAQTNKGKGANCPHNSVVFVFGTSKTQKVQEVIGSGERAIHCGGEEGGIVKHHHILIKLLLRQVIIWATYFIRDLLDGHHLSTHRPATTDVNTSCVMKYPLD